MTSPAHPVDPADAKVHRRLIRVFPVTLAFLAVSWVLFELASRVVAGPDVSFDHEVVVLLRGADDNGRLLGPRWVEEVMRDFTALGGYGVLVLVIISFSILLGELHGAGEVKFFLATSLGGFACSMLMKKLVGRERPGLVPHLSHVETSSFPSSHAMMSAIIFLTIGLLLARHAPKRGIRRLLICLPLFITFLVGISRVFMGVHYPTDVLAGWMGGVVWTWAAFVLFRRRLSAAART